MGDNDDPEPLDPRIQNELERLNKASLLINRLENDLDEARAKFRSLLTESTQQLDSLSKKLGSCIDRAKPYYDSRLMAKEVQVMTTTAATKYERAMSMQTAAREMVELAEQGYESQKPSFDTAWQEMLNHATMKVLDAENERMLSEVEHMKLSQMYGRVQEKVGAEYKSHKRSIVKSKSYYEMKANFHTGLEHQKQSIDKLQTDVNAAKKLYSKALSNLEAISEEIHMKRKQTAESAKLGQREAGVGSENPVPPPVDQKPVFNNNDEQETEIIISFPPAVQNTKDTRLPGVQGKTIHSNSPDKPIDISGIQINISRSDGRTPAIVIDNVVTDGCLLANQLPTSLDSANEQSDMAASVNQQPNAIATTDDILLANQRPVSGASLTESASDQVPDSSDQTLDQGASTDTTYSPVPMRHKRALSGSIKLSAKRLLVETSSVDSDTGSVSSFVGLDDDGVACAMSNEYFNDSIEDEFRSAMHEDYSKLPQSLSQFQKPYESARRSVSSYAPFNEADLKLDQVLKLLEITDDESIV